MESHRLSNNSCSDRLRALLVARSSRARVDGHVALQEGLRGSETERGRWKLGQRRVSSEKVYRVMLLVRVVSPTAHTNGFGQVSRA